MNRDEWNERYAKRMMEQAGLDHETALQAAQASDDDFNEGKTPEQSADDELEHWDGE